MTSAGRGWYLGTAGRLSKLEHALNPKVKRINPSILKLGKEIFKIDLKEVVNDLSVSIASHFNQFRIFSW